MPRHRDIRAKVVKDRIARHEAAWKNMMACLRARDALHKDLNRRFGFMDADGSVGIGKKSHIDSEYVANYEAIEKDHRAKYEKFRAVENEKDKKILTVYEYLLFDNASNDAMANIYRLAQKHPDASAESFIAARAEGEIQRWIKKEYNIAHMMRHENRDFSYRAARCRRFLGAGVLDPRAHCAIRQFKNLYARALAASLSKKDKAAYADYKEAVRSERAESARWILASAIWGIGAYAIFEAWQWAEAQSSGWAELLAFVINVVALFYILAIWPIRTWVSWFLGDRSA